MPSNRHTLQQLFSQPLSPQAIRLEPAALFDQPLAPKRPEFDFKRVEGMLLGLAVGDALGNTSEGLLPSTRRARYGEIRDYLPNRHARNQPLGLPSDDTQLSFWTLEQMIADHGFRPAALAERFCNRRIYGIGRTLRRFIRNHKSGQPWTSCGPASAGNGALMRIAPLLIPHLRSGGTELWSDTALAAMLTHNERASTSACLALNGMLWELLDMHQPPQPQWWLERYISLARPLEGASMLTPRGGDWQDFHGPLWEFAQRHVATAWAQQLSVIDACQAWYSGAYLLETVPSVLYILMRYGHDPEQAIIRAVNDTKDNDTIAAIVGAAVGALHGRQALPARWLDALPGRTTGNDDGRVFALIEQARQQFWSTGSAAETAAAKAPASVPDVTDRGRAMLLAHACGDRFGAPLEFISDASVRSRDVTLDNWTDDTHMSLYLGEAILAHGAGPLDPECFGKATGDAFVRWLHDPLTPSTAPGGTCLRGAANFERNSDWHSSGIAASDGCGAVMRVAPLALAWRGTELLQAARISALLTHVHPNALEAAIACAWLLGAILDGKALNASLVEQAIKYLEGDWSQGGNVADSLRAALAWLPRQQDWLDEAAIPQGDGGWRSGSALGLAIAAALRWPGQLQLAVEKSARIRGDSDSVACLTGALMGAASGCAAIPAHWLSTLPRRKAISTLADQLIQQATITRQTGFTLH